MTKNKCRFISNALILMKTKNESKENESGFKGACNKKLILKFIFSIPFKYFMGRKERFYSLVN